MNTHHHVAQMLKAYRSNPLGSGIQLPSNILQVTKNLSSLVTSGDKPLKDYSASINRKGSRNLAYRRATSTWPRPVQYVPHDQREQALAKYDAAFKKLKASSGKKLFNVPTRNRAVELGLPVPTRHDVQDSINFDVYEALCEALGVPVGTFVDTNVWYKAKSGMLDSGLSHSEIAAEMNRLGITGDRKNDYYGSRELVYQNPKSRFYNVPYKDVLKGSVLTALGVIPLNSRNMSEVLRELQSQSNIQVSGTTPKQTMSYIKDLATRRAELGLQPADTEAQIVVEEAPVGEGSSEVAKQKEQSDSGQKKPKSKALLYTGITVSVLAVGGLAYYYIKD